MAHSVMWPLNITSNTINILPVPKTLISDMQFYFDGLKPSLVLGIVMFLNGGHNQSSNHRTITLTLPIDSLIQKNPFLSNHEKIPAFSLKFSVYSSE